VLLLDDDHAPLGKPPCELNGGCQSEDPRSDDEDVSAAGQGDIAPDNVALLGPSASGLLPIRRAASSPLTVYA
jgi:hypothetical protein